MGSDEKGFPMKCSQMEFLQSQKIKKEKAKQFALLSGEGRVILFRECGPHLCPLRGWVPHQWT